jgi:hypothetical protein
VAQIQLTLMGDGANVGEDGSDERTRWMELLQAELVESLGITPSRLAVTQVRYRPATDALVVVFIEITDTDEAAAKNEPTADMCMRTLTRESVEANVTGQTILTVGGGGESQGLRLVGVSDASAVTIDPVQGGANGVAVFFAVLLSLCAVGGIGAGGYVWNKRRKARAAGGAAGGRNYASHVDVGANSPLPSVGSNTRSVPGLVAGAMVPPTGNANASPMISQYTPPVVVAEPVTSSHV